MNGEARSRADILGCGRWPVVVNAVLVSGNEPFWDNPSPLIHSLKFLESGSVDLDAPSTRAEAAGPQAASPR